MATAWARLVAEVSDAERYPAVRELIDSDAFVEDHDPTDQFEFGLGRMLDGLASLVGARAGSAAK